MINRSQVQQLQMQLMANGGTIGSLGNTPNTSFEHVDIKALKERIKELEVSEFKMLWTRTIIPVFERS